jgi:hypothetical protein
MVTFSLLLIVLAQNGYSFECSTNFADVELMPDVPVRACNMTIATAHENESVGNINVMFSGIPLNISFDPLPTKLHNSSFSTCLNMTAPYFISSGIYVQTAHVISNTTTATCAFNVTVKESRNWTLHTAPFNITVESGVSVVVPIIVRNNGNTIIELSTTVSGNSSNVTTISTNVPAYPNLNTTLSLQVNVPKSYPVGYYNGLISVYAKNTDTDLVQTVPFNLTIIDTLNPSVVSIAIPETMSTKPTTLTVVADDNLGISSIIANFSINRTGYEQYPVVINYTTNETVWQTREIIVPELLATLVLTRIENTNTYTGEFVNTNTIGTYWLNLTTIDQSNNTVSNYTEFRIVPLDMVEYDMYTSVKSMKRPYGLIFTTDYTTPVTLTLQNVTYRGNYTFEFYDEYEQLRGTMDAVGQQLTFTDVGAHYIKVIGDMASDKQGESTAGYMTARFMVSSIPQHIPLSMLIMTTTIINYTLVVPYNMSVAGTQAACIPRDTGDYYTSFTECTFLYPAGTSEDELTVCMTKKEYTEVQIREQNYNTRISDLTGTYWIVIYSVILLIIGGVLYRYVVYPILRELV